MLRCDLLREIRFSSWSKTCFLNTSFFFFRQVFLTKNKFRNIRWLLFKSASLSITRACQMLLKMSLHLRTLSVRDPPWWIQNCWQDSVLRNFYNHLLSPEKNPQVFFQTVRTSERVTRKPFIVHKKTNIYACGVCKLRKIPITLSVRLMTPFGSVKDNIHWLISKRKNPL